MAIEQIYSMVKDKAKLEATWLASASEIKREITAGNSVARLTIGDPFPPGTYCSLLQQFSKTVPFHTMPLQAWAVFH